MRQTSPRNRDKMVLQHLVRSADALLRPRSIRSSSCVEESKLQPDDQMGTDDSCPRLHRVAPCPDRQHDPSDYGSRRTIQPITRFLTVSPPRIGCWIGWLIASTLTGCVRSEFNLATHQQEHLMISTDKEVDTGRKLARRVERDLKLLADELFSSDIEVGNRQAVVDLIAAELPRALVKIEINRARLDEFDRLRDAPVELLLGRNDTAWLSVKLRRGIDCLEHDQRRNSNQEPKNGRGKAS